MKKIISYTAFYVADNFKETNLGARSQHDFCYYNALRLWSVTDENFPFHDAHDMTYNVRDDSEWETLKSRLHERLRKSDNIILILSDITKNSQALREEIDYGVNLLGLPVIITYPDLEMSEILKEGSLNTEKLQNYWQKLPILQTIWDKVPTFHIPFKKNYIGSAIVDPEMRVGGGGEIALNYYTN